MFEDFDSQLTFEQVYPDDKRGFDEIRAFLHRNELNMDDHAKVFIVVRDEERIVACGGVADGIIVCVAIDDDYRGQGIALSLASALIHLANTMGYSQLFIFTKPENEELFSGCGFYSLAQVAGQVVLMENSATRIRQYMASLAALRQPGEKIGSVVMNANPFTRGHRYLVEAALSRCDWLHLFVVSEDVSRFSYADRLRLVREGTADLSRLTVHEGSRYIISRATFPCYFLKVQNIVHQCHMELDLTMFRQYIAPPLGITHRFAGSEPHCIVTNYYNQNMREWLSSPRIAAPPVAFVEIPRIKHQADYISASKVRALLDERKFDRVRDYVPETTWRFLQDSLMKEYA